MDLSASRYGYLDGDGDGYGGTETWDVCAQVVERGDDCDDADASVHPGAPEVCDDGVDRDCDALMDCEDADRMGDAWCAERDCADGDDEDYDGLVDCFDEDCWGTGCGALEVAALGGGDFGVHLLRDAHHDDLRWRRTSSGGARLPSGSDNWSRSRDRLRVRAEDVFGYARWRVASGMATCAWAVASLRWTESQSTLHESGQRPGSSWSSGVSSSVAFGPARQGFALSSACPFSASSAQLLPQTFSRPIQSNRVRPLRSSGGVDWYVPAESWQITTAGGGVSTVTLSNPSYFFVTTFGYNTGAAWRTTTSGGGFYWQNFNEGSSYQLMSLSVPALWAGDVRRLEWRP